VEELKMGLPKEIKESKWYKELPVMDFKKLLGQYRDELASNGVDLDDLKGRELEFVWVFMSGQRRYQAILPLKDVLDHLDEALRNYEESFELGFADMGMNVKIAVEHVKRMLGQTGEQNEEAREG